MPPGLRAGRSRCVRVVIVTGLHDKMVPKTRQPTTRQHSIQIQETMPRRRLLVPIAWKLSDQKSDAKRVSRPERWRQHIAAKCSFAILGFDRSGLYRLAIESVVILDIAFLIRPTLRVRTVLATAPTEPIVGATEKPTGVAHRFPSRLECLLIWKGENHHRREAWPPVGAVPDKLSAPAAVLVGVLDPPGFDPIGHGMSVLSIRALRVLGRCIRSRLLRARHPQPALLSPRRGCERGCGRRAQPQLVDQPGGRARHFPRRYQPAQSMGYVFFASVNSPSVNLKPRRLDRRANRPERQDDGPSDLDIARLKVHGQGASRGTCGRNESEKIMLGHAVSCYTLRLFCHEVVGPRIAILSDDLLTRSRIGGAGLLLLRRPITLG